jgi:hypothetical protein
VPAWIDVRYHPFENDKLFFNADLGYALSTGESYLKANV